MKPAKQIIVVRKDLGMSRGKMAAQVAHASLGCLLKKPIRVFIVVLLKSIGIKIGGPIGSWLNGKFTKITLGVNSEKELLEIFEKAKSKNLNAVLITDAGLTEFNGPTHTCVGIGPHFQSDFVEVTGHLSIFR